MREREDFGSGVQGERLEKSGKWTVTSEYLFTVSLSVSFTRCEHQHVRCQRLFYFHHVGVPTFLKLVNWEFLELIFAQATSPSSVSILEEFGNLAGEKWQIFYDEHGKHKHTHVFRCVMFTNTEIRIFVSKENFFLAQMNFFFFPPNAAAQECYMIC